MDYEDGKTSGIVVYLKDERLAEYIKVKDNTNQSIEVGLSKVEKEIIEYFLEEYENYKNLYNLRKPSKYNEIRDA